MTKIHPEAEAALDAVKGSEIITTMGEGNYVSAVYKDRALEAISQALFERDALRAQVAEMREALKGVCRERNAEWHTTETNGKVLTIRGETEFMRKTEVQRILSEIYTEINAILSKDNSND